MLTFKSSPNRGVRATKRRTRKRRLEATTGSSARNRRALRERLRPRRTPQQSRSRERVELIVETARRLIGGRGNDAVSVREIANEAGVPIASVYQYFPDKNAILLRLMEGYLETIRGRLVSIFGRVERADQLQVATEAALDAFHGLFVEEPALATIWSGVQANTVLRELDAEDTRLNAEFVAGVLSRVLPAIDAEEIRDVSLFAIHIAGATVRLALISDPESAERLLREMKRLARVRLGGLIDRQVQTRASGGASPPR